MRAVLRHALLHDNGMLSPLQVACLTAVFLLPSRFATHRLRITFFGLAPEGCTAAECGDRVLEAAVSPAGQPAQLVASVAYPKPGRYVVRVEVRLRAVAAVVLQYRLVYAPVGCELECNVTVDPPASSPTPSGSPSLAQVTDMRGSIFTHDHTLLVRKHGDPALEGQHSAGAPCCRHTPGIVAQQMGRPVSDTRFRDATAAAQAAAAGWPADNVQVRRSRSQHVCMLTRRPASCVQAPLFLLVFAA